MEKLLEKFVNKLKNKSTLTPPARYQSLDYLD